MAVREEIDLFGGPDLVFGCRHLPAEPADTGVLICLGAPCDPPVDEGRAARLGRRLAGAGVAVQRFHFRGAWPSDCNARRIGFADLVADATRALQLLRDRAGVRRVAFLGARLGALVAARVAHAEPGAPVALWAPDPDPRTALEQAVRARVARQAQAPGRRAAGESGGPSTNGAVVSLDGGFAVPVGAEAHAMADEGAFVGAQKPAPPEDPRAPIDLFDTPLAAELAEGSVVRALADELGSGPRPVYLAVGNAAARETILAGCRARGLIVDVVAHTYDDEREGRPVPGAPADGLVDDTARWLVAQLASGSSTNGTAPRAGA